MADDTPASMLHSDSQHVSRYQMKRVVEIAPFPMPLDNNGSPTAGQVTANMKINAAAWAEFTHQVFLDHEQAMDYIKYLHTRLSALDTLNDQVSAQEVELNNLRRVSNDRLARTQQVEAELESLRATQAQQSTGVTAVTTRKGIKIPDPPLYAGKRDEFREWWSQMAVKFSVNAVDFQTEDSKMGYLYSRLTGTARAQIAPYFDDEGGLGFDSLQGMYQALADAFGDPDRKGTAQRKLAALRQAHKSFAEFYAEFQRYSGRFEIQ